MQAVQYGGAAPNMYANRAGGYDIPFTKGQRKRMNIFSILFAIFVPWVLFCFVFAVLSFGTHYQRPMLAYGLIALALFVGVAVPCVVAAEHKRRGEHRPFHERTWFVFLAGTCLLAFVLAAVGGEANYTTYMQPYYNLRHLHHYQDIDSNLYVGQQLMDAGHIDFKKGTMPDVSQSMGFKNHDMYCVAPIMTKASANKPLSVDFWAVGKNCCSGYSADFHCDGFNNPDSIGAIRLMDDADRPFYRLAVQQAEATYKITATHPLFFEWVQSGEETINHYAQSGRLNFFLGICAYLLIQMFLTAIAAVAFSTMVHS